MPGLPSLGRSKPGVPKVLSLIVAICLAAAILLPLSPTKKVEAWSTDPTLNTPEIVLWQ